MSDELRMELLGGLRISRGGAPLSGFVSSKARALLAYLALSPGPHRREELAGLFWGASSEQDGRASLRVVLSSLRQTAGRDCLVTNRLTVAFNRDMPYWLDVEDFERRARADPQAPVEHTYALRDAADLYRGELLDGVTLSDAPAFDEWLTARREYLRQLAIGALDGLIENTAGSGDVAGAIAYLTSLLELDPWREQAHRQLMTLLARSGRRDAALRQFARCRELLQDDLGVAPEPATTALYEAIRSGHVPGNQPDIAAPAPRPGIERRAPDRSTAARTSFVGRESELGQIIARLNDPVCRLVTLVGPGGVGKSRLALQASNDRRIGFRDGVHIVSLAALSSPDFIAPAIAEELGASVTETDDPARQLGQLLRDKELLLVLDNFEHLVAGVEVLNAIIDVAPRVKLLVTSRERLALRAEWLVTLRGLPVPESTPVDEAASPAVRLFVERARQARPDFTPSNANLASIVAICRLLDGLPLGIELAAGWTRTHTCAEIAARIGENLDFLAAPLRDTPERHHSLRAVFAHSWALLDAREQAVLRALAVFRGGFRSDAAQAVAGASPAHLASLVDKSLLYREPGGRYSLHEQVRQYAYEHLAASPSAADAHRRHAWHYAGRAQALAPQLRSKAHAEATQQILADIDNLRGALLWSTDNGEYAALERALDGVLLFSELAGRHRESRAMLERVVAALTSEPAARQRELRLLHARLLGWLSRVYFFSGRYNEAGELIDELNNLLGERDPAREIPYFLHTSGMIANALGRRDEALRLQQAALEASTASGDRIGMAHAYKDLGGIAFNSGNFADARAWFTRGYQMRREILDWENVGMELSRLGEVARLLGDYAQARRHNEEALAIQRESGSRVRTILPLISLGEVALDTGRLDDAERRFREAHELAEQMAFQRSIIVTECGLATVLLHRGRLDQAWAAVDSMFALARTHGFTIGVLQCLELHSLIAARRGAWQNTQAFGDELLHLATDADNMYQVGRAEALLGRAATALGDYERAANLLQRAATRLDKTGARPAILDVVANAAGLLAARPGAEYNTGTAAELLSFVAHDPATWFPTRQRARKSLAALSAGLDRDSFEAAQQRGRRLTLSNAMQRLPAAR